VYRIKELCHIVLKMKVQTFSRSQCSKLVTLVAAGNLCRQL